MGNTDLNTACNPVSSRRSGATSFCRNCSYDRFWISMRLGISTMDGILPKSFRTRRPHWIVPAIHPPRPAGRRGCHCRRRRDTPSLLQELRKLGRLQQRQRVQLLRDFFDVRRHVIRLRVWLLRRDEKTLTQAGSAAPLSLASSTYTSSRSGACSRLTS